MTRLIRPREPNASECAALLEDLRRYHGLAQRCGEIVVNEAAISTLAAWLRWRAYNDTSKQNNERQQSE